MATDPKLKNLLNVETRFASLGEIPQEAGSEIYTARVIEANFFKAEALVLAGETAPSMFELLRTSFSRGDLKRGADLLAQIQRQGDQTVTCVIEQLLESSRLASFEGEWTVCEEQARAALALAPTGITQLALRQVRATSLIECGRFSEARKEIELALVLSRLFPHANLTTYVAATEARYFVRVMDFEKAKSALNQIWKKLATLNIDVCVVLLRIELELRRAMGKPVERIAFAIWLLCRKKRGSPL